MNRSTIVLVGILGVLAVLAFWVTQRPGEQSRTTASGNRLVEIDSAGVDRIEIRGSAGTVRLERRGMEWFVAGPVQAPAQASTVTGALSQACDLRIKSIVSSKPEKHQLFQVDTVSGTMITLFEGSSHSASIIVGKPAEGYADTYARVAGSDDVALVSGSFGWTFNKPVRDWRDRTILTLERAEIREVLYRYGDTTFTLAWRDSVWRIEGRAANTQSVEGVLNALTSLQCDDFAESPSAGKLVATLTVAGQQVRFSRESGGTRYLVQTSSGPQWYIMESWRADQVLKRKRDLL